MSDTRKLSLSDVLPLTCTRSGTCCHGKMVLINPWELANLAKDKKLSSGIFRDLYCQSGGVQLSFNGEHKWNNLQACSQYIPNFGCSVHKGRPLVCRLYPLGRQKQNETVHYIHQGKTFPCLEGCPDVIDLPQISVDEYIRGQLAHKYELAQDEYLEMMQNLAEGAFTLLLDSGLVESGDCNTLQQWRKIGSLDGEQLSEKLGALWIDRLMLPQFDHDLNDPKDYVKKHYDLLIEKLEESIESHHTLQDYSEASILMMSLALLLGRGLGANPIELVDHWIKTAISLGALEQC